MTLGTSKNEKKRGPIQRPHPSLLLHFLDLNRAQFTPFKYYFAPQYDDDDEFN